MARKRPYETGLIVNFAALFTLAAVFGAQNAKSLCHARNNRVRE
jgi:hypothetical protein